MPVKGGVAKAVSKLEPDTWYEADDLPWGRHALQEMRSDGSGPPFVKVRGVIMYRGGAVLDWLRKLEGKG